MSLFAQIKEDLKQALKAKQDLRLSVLRQVWAALKNEAIDLQKDESDLSDDEVIKILKKESKKRKDSIVSYNQAGRGELAEVETQELEMINSYLPAEMDENSIKQIIDEVVTQAGGIALSSFGKIMKEVMTRLAGRADGKVVSQLVKDRLSK